jgi:hypothetical protein
MDASCVGSWTGWAGWVQCRVRGPGQADVSLGTAHSRGQPTTLQGHQVEVCLLGSTVTAGSETSFRCKEVI